MKIPNPMPARRRAVRVLCQRCGAALLARNTAKGVTNFCFDCTYRLTKDTAR